MYQVGDTRNFVVSDRTERKRLNDAIKDSIATIKTLTAKRKEIQVLLSDKKTCLESAKKAENAVKEQRGKQSPREVLHLVERVFARHCISKPFYHEGKYNGKAMNKFMTNSQKIMNDLSSSLLLLPAANRCGDDEVVEVTSKFKSVLQVFDFIFSKARTPSGLIAEPDVQELKDYIYLGMKLWRELELTVEAPKPHAIEDHLCDQMLRFNGIGDLGEDWVEQAHQDGIRDEGRSRSIKDRGAAAILHCNWEQKRKLPQVIAQSDQVQQKCTRTKKARIDSGEVAVMVVSKRNEKLQSTRTSKLTTRMAAFASISSSTKEGFITTGRQRNIREYIPNIIIAQSLMNQQIRVMLAKIRAGKRRAHIIIIQKRLRVLFATIFLRRQQHASLLLSLL